jgi:hypothetical protein
VIGIAGVEEMLSPRLDPAERDMLNYSISVCEAHVLRSLDRHMAA